MRGLQHTFAQQRESTIAIASEHGIVDARHQRSISRERLGLGQLHLMEFTGSIVQIQLVEHAVLPVTGQRRPVLAAKRLALGKEATQIGHIGDILGREEGSG